MKAKTLITGVGILVLAFTFALPAAQAKPNEFDAIATHLKTQHKAKKVHIPFMWLAKFAVKIVRPAGVKSFNVTLFEDLKFSAESLDAEMQQAMRRSFDSSWTSIMRVRSRDGQQVYMYMREDGGNVKVAFVAIDKEEAELVKATFSPDKLAEFINNPKIFGISLNDDNSPAKTVVSKSDNDHD